ncbi:glycoside hydrolase [Corynascus novoguineensis]|uniref:Glycoside hydrolase n=1 Tax=Corynascus novoguineensis TaxID=1126955 RepID=A0AAN7CZP0_9PEZI|nr:glycoside hydrolase [Corynascus novoguineensis]
MVRPASSIAVLAFTAASTARAASYGLVDAFDASNFFDEFDFFTEPDPTHGFVQYVDGDMANREGLAGFASGGVYLGVDYNRTTMTGRASVRVTSKKAYTRGLFVADIAHMPAGAAGSSSCGLWPAFWMFGPDWPSSGEIDIIEGVNSQAANSVSLHTGPGCTVSNVGSAPGTRLVTADCQNDEGCTQDTSSAPESNSNYGTGFNAAGGGVYAVEWTDAAIKVWFFPQGSPTASQLSSFSAEGGGGGGEGKNTTSPDPSAFGTPLAVFANSNNNIGDDNIDNDINSCAFDAHFADHRLVFDTTFCGDWAGRAWHSDAACAALAPACEDYVGAHPEAFSEAYWLVRGIRVYQLQSEDGDDGLQLQQQGRKVKRGIRGRRGMVDKRRWRA